MARLLSAIALACLIGAVAAQDPAPGWLAYATATCPAGQRITHMEADWTVLDNPTPSGAFFSPWFGIDTTSNLNLLQPVNPWFGSSWSIYTEYFQWSPVNNQDSQQMSTSAGNQLHGEVTFQGASAQSYKLSQTDKTASQTSSMTIPVQQNSAGGYKNYTVMYIVFEKVAQCWQYPPNGKVTFRNIKVYCNDVLVSPSWTTSFVEDVCDFRAHVESSSQVSITWNTTSAKAPTPEQVRRSQETPFRRFAKRG